MVDLQSLANQPGWGKAHKELSRAGHPTETPRAADVIEYRVFMRGPRGDSADVEVMAQSVTDAIAQARHLVFSRDLLEVCYSIDDDEDIKIVKVCANE